MGVSSSNICHPPRFLLILFASGTHRLLWLCLVSSLKACEVIARTIQIEFMKGGVRSEDEGFTTGHMVIGKQSHAADHRTKS